MTRFPHYVVGDDIETPDGRGIVADRRSYVEEVAIHPDDEVDVWLARIRSIYGSSLDTEYQCVLVTFESRPAKWFEVHECREAERA